MSRASPKPAVRSKEERDRLVLQFYSLPYHVAFVLARKCPTVKAMGKDEAAQWGFIGLIRAAELWESDRANGDPQASFKTYAYKAVYQHILRAAGDDALVAPPQSARRRGHQPLKWKQSLSYLYADQRNYEAPAKEQVVDDGFDDNIQHGLDTLPSRHQEVIKALFVDNESSTSIGKRSSPPVTASRINMIKQDALRRLRKHFCVEDQVEAVS